MSRTIIIGNLAVISGALVSVRHYQRERGTGGFSLKDAGEDFYLVGFLALGSKSGLTRFSPIKKLLDIFCLKRKSGRAAIYNYTDGLSMGLPPGGDFENVAECRAIHNVSLLL